MKNIPYLEIFKQAWVITWRNRFLWWLGFLILLGSFSGNLNFRNDSSDMFSQSTDSFTILIQNRPGLAIFLAALFFLLLTLTFVLRILGKIGIIKAVSNLGFYSKQKLRIVLRSSLPYLGNLLLLEIIFALGILALLLVLAIPIVFLFYLKAFVFGTLVTLGALAIFLPTLVLAYFILKFAYFYRVLGELKLLASIEAAYFLCKENLKESLLIALCFLAIGILFGITVLLALALAALLALIVAAIPYLIFGKMAAIITGSLILPLVLILLLTTLSAWEAFKQTAWLLFFQELAAKKITDEKPTEITRDDALLNPGAIN